MLINDVARLSNKFLAYTEDCLRSSNQSRQTFSRRWCLRHELAYAITFKVSKDE